MSINKLLLALEAVVLTVTVPIFALLAVGIGWPLMTLFPGSEMIWSTIDRILEILQVSCENLEMRIIKDRMSEKK